ncbi:MAG: hypothetical protein AVDCRST_MAG96-3390 [uncultured Segetibacter sp.]|uniref:Uncharacterized protein n=1 Tax=uncultured Segetibacter sp. TaxID=481133 RepID=A0A6J4TQH2_9BACT|nr:MAG: hypothetical protein AVDCRST_MAG96-3390 [uncultured Segetibacter sp.]
MGLPLGVSKMQKEIFFVNQIKSSPNIDFHGRPYRNRNQDQKKEDLGPQSQAISLLLMAARTPRWVYCTLISGNISVIVLLLREK